MFEFYPQIKLVHIAAVTCSGILFLLRGLLIQFGSGAITRHAALRYLSYTIDSILLTAALMLLTILPSAMFANGWVWMKIGLLLVYIGLGVQALREKNSQRLRWICFIAALCVFAFIVSVARAHHPAGLLLTSRL